MDSAIGPNTHLYATRRRSRYFLQGAIIHHEQNLEQGTHGAKITIVRVQRRKRVLEVLGKISRSYHPRKLRRFLFSLLPLNNEYKQHGLKCVRGLKYSIAPHTPTLRTPKPDKTAREKGLWNVSLKGNISVDVKTGISTELFFPI